jgi:hypothetical protein
VVPKVYAIDQHDPDVERVEGLRQPGGELRSRERDEAAGHAALGYCALGPPAGQRIEHPAILAR